MDENERIETALFEIEKADSKARRLGVDEPEIISAMFRHAVELAMTAMGPGKARRWLKTALNYYTSPRIIKSRRHWIAEICADCGLATIPRPYWVDCAVWERAWPGDEHQKRSESLCGRCRRRHKAGTLCIPCLEARVGRPLKARDFKDLEGREDLKRWLNYRRLRSIQRRRPRPRSVR